MSYEFKTEDAYGLARAIGADIHEKGDELFFKYCPQCRGGGNRDKNTFSVNLKSGLFKCFRASCDYHGHFVELARDFDYDLGFGEKRVYRKLPQKPVVVRNGAIEYMAKRGISSEICRKYELTTRTDNKDILVFPFYDETGTLQFVKYRNMKFRKGIDKNKEWSEAETMPILFGIKQCKDFDRLIITEGQIDSLSVAECGFNNAVSVPTGATGFTWLANCWDWITKFHDVVVFGDNEHGKITLADTLRARLPQTVKVVRKKDYLGEKDANDILLKYGKQAIRAAIENAEIPQLENVKDLALVQSVDINALPKIKTNIPDIDRLIGGLVMGQVILLTGKRGHGKSTFMSIVTGKMMPDEGKVEWAKNVNVGYLDQHAVLEAGMTIQDALKSAFDPLLQKEERMNEICDMLGTADEKEMEILMEELGMIQDELTLHDFYTIDAKVEEVARALGLLDLGLDRDVTDLSGGQRTKVLLGKLLLEKPDILLLDEPTNYLDEEHIAWLKRYLLDYENAFILISHDIPFLNEVVNII